jgi:hypothetical protein
MDLRYQRRTFSLRAWIYATNYEIHEATRANRRSFDCASRDETAGGFAQDDIFGEMKITTSHDA